MVCVLYVAVRVAWVPHGMAFHHGGLSYRDRTRVQELFVAGHLQLVWCVKLVCYGYSCVYSLATIQEVADGGCKRSQENMFWSVVLRRLYLCWELIFLIQRKAWRFFTSDCVVQNLTIFNRTVKTQIYRFSKLWFFWRKVNFAFDPLVLTDIHDLASV